MKHGDPADLDHARPSLSIVVAAAENGVIGAHGRLPWRLPADLAHFKRLTMGHAMIMGRRTYESIGKTLPGRVSIVLTRDRDWRPAEKSILVAHDLADALRSAATTRHVAHDKAFVIGGGEVYRLALPHADRVYLTQVHAHVDGDATFPSLDPAEWRLVDAEGHPPDAEHEHGYTFQTWSRVRR